MRNKYVFVLVMLLCISLVSAGFTGIYLAKNNQMDNDSDITIVTSFYPMYIATMNVTDGIDGIKLENLSEPQTGCLHDFQLTPEDMKLLSKADVFIVNGGGIETFMKDVAAAYPNLKIIEACENLDLLSEESDSESDHEEEHDHEEDYVHEENYDHEEEHDHGEEHNHGDVNAHAWMSVELYRQQVLNIADELAKVDAGNAQAYADNAKNYDGELAKLQEEQQKIFNYTNNQNIVTLHEAFKYIAKDYSMNVCADMDLDEERQISAGEVAGIISSIKEENVSFVLAEELYAKDIAKVIESETDAEVIFIDPLNRGEYKADSYIENMSKNIELLKAAFAGKE